MVTRNQIEILAMFSMCSGLLNIGKVGPSKYLEGLSRFSLLTKEDE